MLTPRDPGADRPSRKFFEKVPRLPAHLKGEIWAIATYFNPAHYSNKLTNLRRFSEAVRSQGLPLLIVELAFGGDPFSIQEGLADRLIQVRSNSILWQKERLLNIALEELPATCDKVAWLDADVLFENRNLVDETCKLLEDYVAVQLYDVAWWLPENCKDPFGGDSRWSYQAYSDPIFGLAFCQIRDKGPVILDGQPEIAGHPGFGWAMRRSVLERHNFYDRLILGSADIIMGWAMFGYAESPWLQQRLTQKYSHSQVLDILNWTKGFYSDVRGSVVYAPGSVLHLWHGTSKDRRYVERLSILREANFDPARDIRLDANCCWQWSSDKPELHAKVEAYFKSRREESC